MVSINLSEVKNKEQIAEVIREKMEINGIKKSDIIAGAHLSKSAINNVLCLTNLDKGYRLDTLLKVLDYLKIQLFIGRNKEDKSKVLSLF